MTMHQENASNKASCLENKKTILLHAAANFGSETLVMFFVERGTVHTSYPYPSIFKTTDLS